MKHKDLIKKMTLEQKASMMSGKTVWETQDIPELGIVSIWLSDGPSGLRKQAGESDQLGLNESLKATCFPSVAAVTNSWNPEIAEKVGAAIGNEAKARRVSVLLGPGCNTKRNPLCGRNFEYSSEDPYLAGKIDAGYIRGIQSNGIAACVKHFATNSQELKRESMDSVVDERTLRELYLTNFEIAVKEGKAKTIMSAYNSLNGYFANENVHLEMDILRDEWKFDGVVVTDWGGNNDRVEGLKCLNSLEMPSTAGETNREIVKAIKDGKLDESILDENVDLLLNLIDATKTTYTEDQPVDFDGNDAIAKQAMDESVVLLRNEGNILPLAKDVKVAVVGDFAEHPRYQGAGSSIINPHRIVSGLEAVKNSDLNFIGYAEGFKRFGRKTNARLVKEALALADQADVVLLYLGLDEFSEVEGMDRTSYILPQNQVDLLKALRVTGVKIVVVLSCGCAVKLGAVRDNCDAIVYGSLCGQSGAQSIVDVIEGKVNPSGKLSESFPCQYKDVPSAGYYPGKDVTAEYREGLFVGYRYYLSKDIKVCYPFGYGLSYSTFEYFDLAIDGNGVTFKVKNTSKVDGKEVSQLYVGLKNSMVIRPIYELKGFTKTLVKAGKSETVTIKFDDKTFRYFNTKTNKWEVEGGEYDIYIGASSEDIKLKGTLKIEGTNAPAPYTKEELPHYFAADVTNVPDAEFEKLLGRPIPPNTFNWLNKRKTRIEITSNTTMSDLRYAKGWTGRFFAHVISGLIKMFRKFGNEKMADTLIMGVSNQTVKVLSRMTNGMMSWDQLQGLLLMFNGHFHKGVHQYFKAGREKKKLAKELKAQTEQKAA